LHNGDLRIYICHVPSRQTFHPLFTFFQKTQNHMASLSAAATASLPLPPTPRLPPPTPLPVLPALLLPLAPTGANTLGRAAGAPQGTFSGAYGDYSQDSYIQQTAVTPISVNQPTAAPAPLLHSVRQPVQTATLTMRSRRRRWTPAE
jgi:hypothetical protein